MAQQPGTSPHLPAGDDHSVVLFPTRYAAYVPGKPPTKPPGVQVGDPAPGVRKHEIRQVAVLEVACRLGDIVEELDRGIQLALAEGPRGVVCDLSGVIDGDEPGAIEVLASAGRHVRDWPGVPVAVACPDPQVRESIRAQPLGAHLIVTPSLFSSVTAVLAIPDQSVKGLRLHPHPTAARASREFVTRTLLEWSLGRVSPFASLVISELVASSTINAGTDIEVSVAWNQDALRLTVRDHGPGLPGQRPSSIYLHGRRLTVVAGLARTFGVLPTADGGKVVWAVLEAPMPSPSDSLHRVVQERQESLILNHARGLAKRQSDGKAPSQPSADPFRPVLLS
ncbi:MAG: ATP-binding protein [Actinomycetota bacterium]